MQAIDFSLLSLEEFSEKCGFANAGKTRTRVRRDLTDAMRGMYWYHGVRRAMGIASAYGLERRIEPEAFKVSADGKRHHRNKWPSYRSGRRVPSRALVDRVEVYCPGTSAEMNSVLWPALSSKALSVTAIDALILRLDLRIQGVVRRNGTRYQRGKDARGAVDQRLADTLERHASLDALAAIVLMLRRASVLGHNETAYIWGRQAYRMLMLLGLQLLDRGIARPLLELMQQRIFPMATWSGVGYWMPTPSFLSAARGLQWVLGYVRDVPIESMTEKQKLDYMRQAMGVRLGWDYRYAFNPIRRGEIDPLASKEQPTAARGEAQWIQRDRWCHEWAWNMLQTGGHPEAPPSAVYLGGDVWARAKTHPAAFDVGPAAA